MSLFQRRPQIADPIQYVSNSLQKTVLIVGLGNPGEQYDLTRHNIGFHCLDAFAKKNDFEDWANKKDLKCHLASLQMNDTRCILMKPTTFMNLSGEAVQAVSQFYKIHPDQIAVVHDELDVDFGLIRTRKGGGAAGHNGIKSVTQHMGENYGRVRIGIGPKYPEQMDSADFVLQKFNADEQTLMPDLTREVIALLSEFVYAGGTLPADTRNFLL
jgi:PTH1 family peptidyl-tRNA hydrolase